MVALRVKLVVMTAAVKDGESKSGNGSTSRRPPAPKTEREKRRHLTPARSGSAAGAGKAARVFRAMVMVFVLIGFLHFCQVIFRPGAACLPVSEELATVRSMKLRLLVEFDPGAKRWSAVFPELPGCASAGDTEKEAIQNAREALALWFEPSELKLKKGTRLLEVSLP